MNLIDLKAQLRAHPDALVSVLLPDGSKLPAHFHVTEVGRVEKNFVDCGGTFRRQETCVLQTWIGPDSDSDHRLQAGKLAHILELGRSLFPSSELPVEVEYEQEFISQFPVDEVTTHNGVLTLQLGLKHTDCLAKQQCGIEEGCGCDSPDRTATMKCGAAATTTAPSCC